MVLVKDEHRSRYLGLDSPYLSSLFGQSILFSIVTICGTQLVSSLSTFGRAALTLQMMHVGLLPLSLSFSFAYTLLSGGSSALSNGHPFPPTVIGSAILSVCLLFVGVSMYLYIQRVSEDHNSSHSSKRIFTKIPSSVSAVFVVLFTFHALLYLSKSNAVSYHPIDLLIYEATSQHTNWVKQASSSKTLRQATEEYRRRYKRHPPP